MSFYLRKSIKVGAFKFNFSKSGIGISTGIKGFRIGTGPRGNYIHAGAHGFYYKKAIRNFNKTQHTNIHSIEQESGKKQVIENIEYEFKDIESGNVDFMVDNSFEDILLELNTKTKKISFVPFGIIISIGLMFLHPLCIVSVLLTLPLSVFLNKKRKTTYIIYDIETEIETKLQKFYDSFDNIINSKKKWHISSSANVNSDYGRKINGGATNLIKRTNIDVKYDIPKYIVSNIKIPTVPVGKQILYFFPERILIKDGKKFGTINYQELEIDYGNTQFIETEGIPIDSEIVGKTWKYVNKRGGPDKRFKDNVELPILKYSEISFKSTSGLNERIQISRPDLGSELYDAIKKKDKI